MASTVTATDAQNHFGELIRRVYTTGESVTVEKDGMPVVVVSRAPEPQPRKNTQKDETSIICPQKEHNP